MIKLLWEKGATIAIIVSIIMFLHYWLGSIPIWYFIGIEVLVAIIFYEITISLYSGFIETSKNSKEKEARTDRKNRKSTKYTKHTTGSEQLKHKNNKLNFNRINRVKFDDRVEWDNGSNTRLENLPEHIDDDLSISTHTSELDSPVPSVIIDEDSDNMSDVTGISIDLSEVSAKEVEEFGLQIDNDESVEIE